MIHFLLSFLLFITDSSSFKNIGIYQSKKTKQPINTYSFMNKVNKPIINLNTHLYMNPKELVTYLTSIRDYTIITDTYKNKNIEDSFMWYNMDIYYVNVNNLINKNDILDYLKKEYKDIDITENLWIFHKGYYLGSRSVIQKIIKGRIIKKKSIKNENETNIENQY